MGLRLQRPAAATLLLIAVFSSTAVLGCQQGCSRRRLEEEEPAACPVLLATGVPAPVTPKRPALLHANASFGAPPRADDYAWLRDDFRNNTVVLSHLQEENAYTEAVLSPTVALQQALAAEMRGRLPREEASTPQRRGRHWYYAVRGEGRQYWRHARRPLASPDARPTEHDAVDAQQPEETLLDEDELAAGHSYFDLSGPEYSPDEALAAYGLDLDGSEVYTLYLKNLSSGALVLDGGGGGGDASANPLRTAAGDYAFMTNSRTLLFTTLSADTHRAHQVWRLQLGSSGAAAGAPELLFEEPDERFQLNLWRSRSGALIMLQGSAHSSQYVRYMPAGAAGAAGAAAFTTLAPALPDRLLLVRDWQAPASSSGSESDSSGETGGGDSARSSISRGALIYAIVAGPDSRNGQLVVGPLAPDVLAGSIPDAPSAASQGGSSGGDSSEAGGGGGAGEGDGRALDEGESAGSGLVLLQAHSRDVELVDLVVTSTHLAVLERRNGTLRALSYALPADGSPLAELPEGREYVWEDSSYSLSFSGGQQGPFDSPLLRVRYSSLTHPDSTYDINMATGNRVLRKQQQVVGVEPGAYLSRLLWANSTGGARVPLSVAYRGDAVRLDGSDPLLLQAYGAYGAAFDPEFSSELLSLLDRGFVYAIAHVRGGGDMGQYWYQAGKLLQKTHTFDDVAAAAAFLIASKYTSAERLALWGRSAGGLTAGAAINRRPELFKAAILDVPFVDVLSTMQDPSLPLTVAEYDEWGDPSADAEAYSNIASYSPLDNVVPQAYPHLLLTGGLRDPRVSYWEPAKMAAKVRDLTTSGSLVLLHTDMVGGHFSLSGLERKIQDAALKYAFLIQTVAPCATQPASQRAAEAGGDGCRYCFAFFVAVVTAAAVAVLAVVLNPSSRMGHKWRRLRGEAEPGRHSSGAEEGFGEDELGEATLEAQRQRSARQQQLDEQGLSLTPYDAVRTAVRDRLVSVGAPASAAVGTTPPKRRLQLTTDGGGAVELASILPGSRGALLPIVESPRSQSSAAP